MPTGAASVVAVLATAGIEAAKVAVLAVLGLMLAAAAAYYGYMKLLTLLGYGPLGSVSDMASASADRYLSEESARASEQSGDWIYAWDDASGTRGADVNRW